MKTLREVCEILNVSRRAVQGYEQAGLIRPSGKNKYGYLLYDETAVERIRIIKQHQDFGFSIKQIKVLLCATDEVYLKMMNKQLGIMYSKLWGLTEKIKEAEKTIQWKEKN